MDTIELNLENVLLHSYGCKLCREKAIEIFYDLDTQEAILLYSRLFCNKCIAAKIAVFYEEYKNTLEEHIKTIRELENNE